MKGPDALLGPQNGLAATKSIRDLAAAIEGGPG